MPPADHAGKLGQQRLERGDRTLDRRDHLTGPWLLDRGHARNRQLAGARVSLPTSHSSSLPGPLHARIRLNPHVWSRKILGWEVHETESDELAAALIKRIRLEAGDIDLTGWVLHSDNGGHMKGATMLATLQRLGVVTSFSRPGVSDDNPYSEALFRTLKYCPEYPSAGFATVADARAWVARFVAWYNHEHCARSVVMRSPRCNLSDDDSLWAMNCA